MELEAFLFMLCTLHLAIDLLKIQQWALLCTMRTIH